jgi:Uncharacterized protein conserved in bacteria (DUF2141)
VPIFHLGVGSDGRGSDRGVVGVARALHRVRRSHALRTGFVDIHDGRSVMTFRLLKPGTYAVNVFHDENNNETLARDWLGCLVEPTAVSNNLNGTCTDPHLTQRSSRSRTRCVLPYGFNESDIWPLLILPATGAAHARREGTPRIGLWRSRSLCDRATRITDP